MPWKTDRELRHADLSDCRGRVSPYFTVGQRIGSLEVVDDIERKARGDGYRIPVRCTSCNGPTYWCRVDHLRYGRCKQCTDCQRRPEPVFAMDCNGDLHNISGVANTAHELHQIYKRCVGAQQRCSNGQNHAYERYGGRGILFEFDSPMTMLAYVIGLPGFTQALENGLTIDRIANNGNYAPGNLRWTSAKAQASNRRNTRYVELSNGQSVKRPQAVDVIHSLTGRKRNSLNSDFYRGKTFAEVWEYAQRKTGNDSLDPFFDLPPECTTVFADTTTWDVTCCNVKLVGIPLKS